MKKYIKLFCVLAVICAIVAMIGCEKNDGYKEYNGDISDIKTEINSSRNNLLSGDSLSLTYSYMVSTEINKETVRLGKRDNIALNKLGDDFEMHRFSYYYGTEDTVADTFYYADGKVYTELYNTEFCAPITKDGFLAYTDGTRYANDRAFLDTKSFAELYVKKEDGKTLYRFVNDDGTMSKKIIAFLGFNDSDYIYGVQDIVYTITVLGDGSFGGESMTFKATYAAVNSTNNEITYDGEFKLEINGRENVKVNSPVILEDIKEINDITLVADFEQKAFGILSTQTTLDANYTRVIEIADGTQKYGIENIVHFTEAMRDEKYTYGSLDAQRYETPKEIERTEKGIFIDADGYHYRSTNDDPYDPDELPYTPAEMMTMVAATLCAEMPLAGDIVDLDIEELDEYVLYRFSYSDEAIVYYGEYLLSAFAESGSEASLNGMSVKIDKNESVVKVRKSDGCLVLHKLSYKATFGSNIEIKCDFNMTVNAIGDDVKVLTLGDWNK